MPMVRVRLIYLLEDKARSADYLAANLNADQKAREFIASSARLMREAAEELRRG